MSTKHLTFKRQTPTKTKENQEENSVSPYKLSRATPTTLLQYYSFSGKQENQLPLKLLPELLPKYQVLSLKSKDKYEDMKIMKIKLILKVFARVFVALWNPLPLFREKTQKITLWQLT